MTDKDFERAIVSISKEDLANLPAAEYPGKIVLIDNKIEVAEAVADLNKVAVIGFDTETRPSFRRGQHFDVSLIQLSTEDCCYLFRTSEIGFPTELMDILENPDILKVGLSIHDDFHNLHKVANFEPQGFIDLQPFVKDFKIADNSLSRLYGILFDERISKSQRLTNWEQDDLTPSQQHYAALDAYACLKIYNYLKDGKFDPKESKYLMLPPEPSEEAGECEEELLDD